MRYTEFIIQGSKDQNHTVHTRCDYRIRRMQPTDCAQEMHGGLQYVAR